MIRKLTFVVSTAAGAAMILVPGVAPARSAKACAAEYAERGKAAGTRAAFMRHCEGEGSRRPGAHRKKPDDPLAPPKDATTIACTEEYENNKAAVDGSGQTRAKFIKDCKNGTEDVPGGIKSPPPTAETTPPPLGPQTIETRPAPASPTPTPTPAPAAPAPAPAPASPAPSQKPK